MDVWETKVMGAGATACENTNPAFAIPSMFGVRVDTAPEKEKLSCLAVSIVIKRMWGWFVPWIGSDEDPESTLLVFSVQPENTKHKVSVPERTISLRRLRSSRRAFMRRVEVFTHCSKTS